MQVVYTEDACLVKISYFRLHLIWLWLCCICSPAWAAPVEVTLLFFNDVHGYLQPHALETDQGPSEEGGLARMAYLVRMIRAENRRNHVPTFVLCAGDILQGTLLSTLFKGQADVAVYNAMGVDAMVVGNHEFDYGLDNFLNLQQEARFAFISSNLARRSTGKRLVPAFSQLPLSATLALTVIGATTPELAQTTHPDNVADLKVHDPLQTVAQAYARAQDKGPVLLLSHNRHDQDRALARAIPGLALIIGGHDHSLLDPPPTVAGVPIFQAGEKGRHLGRVDLTIDPDTYATRVRSYRYIAVSNEIPNDPQVAELIAAYRQKMGLAFDEVLGHAPQRLAADRQHIRYEETAIGNWVTDIMRVSSGADLALLNSGSIRAGFEKGPISLDDVFRILPFDNEIVLVTLSGDQLWQVLDRAVMGERHEQDGGFLQVSGLYMTVAKRQVTHVHVGQKAQPLDPQRRYRVAITDFMAAGGDGYKLFAELTKEYTGLPLRELVIDHIRRGQIVSAQAEGRILRP
jgi:2',3'-cyclic-nucleotide 2'-phosphodiesterase (5'-nucleotidase family)